MQYILGKGKGKTTYLTQQFLRTGGAYFEFHGKLDEVIEGIPPERWESTVVFDPTDPIPIGFNYLEPTAVLETLKSAWHYEGSTPILDLYTYNTIASLAYVPDATLLGVLYMLTAREYRARCMGYIKDPILKKFWKDYEQLPPKEQRQQTLSTLNKFYALLSDRLVRNVIGQKRTSFKDKDIVATFPPSLGKEKASFLATLLLHYLPDYPIYLDGGHNLGPRAIQEKTQITFSHDYLEQLSRSMQEYLIGSSDALIAFRLGPKDAERLSVEFELGQCQWSLTELPDFTYHKRTTRTYSDQELPEPTWPLYNPNRLRTISRSKNGRPNAEQSINKFLGSRHES